MASVITVAFENWKAQEAASGKAVLLDEFVFANVPNLDPTKPIDRNEKLPPANQIVHRQAVNKAGLASENAVAYSVTMGADVGNFDFNWIGLLNKASGTVAMITHAPTQKKLKTQNGQQGNVLTRSFILEFQGAAEETQIKTSAETWQIDFTARLSGIDEMQRLINVDSYGAAAFFNESFEVTRSGEQFTVKKGLGYVGGLRGELAQNQILNGLRNTKVYADFSYQGNIVSQWNAVVKITSAAALNNYVDAAGFTHQVFAIASIDTNGNVKDLRPMGALSDQRFNEFEKQYKLDISKKIDKANITHQTGNSTELVVSQLLLNDEMRKAVLKSQLSDEKYPTDSAKIPKVGDFGLGVRNGSVTILADILDIKSSGKYIANGNAHASKTKNMPEESGNYIFAVEVSNVRANAFNIALISLNQLFTGYLDTNTKTVLWNKGASSKDVDTVSTELEKKFNKSSVKNELGQSEQDVISQKTVTEKLNEKIDANIVSIEKYPTDATQIPKVGNFGLGVKNGTVDILADVFDIKSSGKYVANGNAHASKTKNMPTESGNYIFSVEVSNIRNNTFNIFLGSVNQYFVGYVDIGSKTVMWSEIAKLQTVESVKNTLLGINQAWVNLTSTRALNTKYSNTTPKPISVSAVVSGSAVYCYFIVNGVNTGYGHSPASGTTAGASAIIPPGAEYELHALAGSGQPSLKEWSELR